jgi:hypothetical protein
MTLLGSQQTGLGSVPTAGEDGAGGVDPSAAVDSVTTTDPLLSIDPTTGDVLISQRIGATWGTAGSVRYFACDGTNGSDTNAGFSDVSQAAAGLVAVKTIAKLLTLIPKFGYGRIFRAAIRSGNYASDTFVDLSGFVGYQKTLIIATDTIASAGAVAFAGDANDTIAAGMTTATGMNAAGYNPTAYSVAADGTPTITLQLAGGGAPAFPAAPARPYLCRLRFDVNTHTAALRNFCDSILLVPTGAGGAQLIIGQPLPGGVVDPTDVCYIEMPNVTGLTKTAITNSGSNSASLTVAGINFGVLVANGGSLLISGCESTAAVFSDTLLICQRSVSNVPSTTRTIGTGLRCDGTQVFGGTLSLADSGDTGLSQPTLFQEPESITIERWSAPGAVLYGGAHALGNNITETIGTNPSTAHGATCQVWAAQTTTQGVAACGLAVYGGYTIGRIKFSNMGAHPGLRINGAGLGVVVQGISGGVADGNLDVGLDLTPVGGTTAGGNGCTIALAGTPTVTGTVGDIRLANGQIVTWAAVAATGLVDSAGNRFISASAPLAVVKAFSGVILTSNSAPTFGYLADIGTEAVNPTANQTDPIGYPTSARLITRLRGCQRVGTGSQAPTFTLYKNGVATAQTVTLPASTGGQVTAVDLAHPILFADGDTFDVRCDFATTAEGNQPVSATLEGPC